MKNKSKATRVRNRPGNLAFLFSLLIHFFNHFLVYMINVQCKPINSIVIAIVTSIFYQKCFNLVYMCNDRPAI